MTTSSVQQAAKWSTVLDGACGRNVLDERLKYNCIVLRA